MTTQPKTGVINRYLDYLDAVANRRYERLRAALGTGFETIVDCNCQAACSPTCTSTCGCTEEYIIDRLLSKIDGQEP